jgi:uncharacterized damage-inducible protein DinB
MASVDLREHIRYSAWASARLVEAAARLSHADLLRDHGTADRSVLGTLAHVYAADRLWLGRIENAPTAAFLDPEKDHQIGTLENEWPALLARWDTWIARQSDASIREPLTYRNLKGQEYSMPVWQIVLHVVNHGTHHRGQVAGFLRSMGHTPPPLDLIYFYRAD